MRFEPPTGEITTDLLLVQVAIAVRRYSNRSAWFTPRDQQQAINLVTVVGNLKILNLHFQKFRIFMVYSCFVYSNILFTVYLPYILAFLKI